MKKTKKFDAVKMMRDIRDRMSKEMKGLTPTHQVQYIKAKSGVRKQEQQELAR